MAGPILYFKNDSPPVRSVKLCLLSLDLTVQLKQVTFAPGETLDTAFLKQNPRRSLPALVDGDLLICDSHAINAYLVSAYGKNDTLYPKDSKDRALIDQRLYFDAGEIFPTIKQIAVNIFSKKATHLDEETVVKIRTIYATTEQFLKGRKYIASDVISIADFSYFTSLTTLEVFLPELDDYPNVVRYLLTCMDTIPGCHDDRTVYIANFNALYQAAVERNRSLDDPS
ncbi:hypothetical protein M8J76_006252 [Diaphorina citri]|nr:hypothetical protein M8J76_006252 [Diaphorina citri]